MQLFTQGQWWSNVCNETGTRIYISSLGNGLGRGGSIVLGRALQKSIISPSLHLPLYSDCIQNNVSTSVVDRIYRWHTISFSQWCHWFQHFYRGVREIPLRDPHRGKLHLLVEDKNESSLRCMFRVCEKDLGTYLLVLHRDP